jgi:hypothetical protein
VRGELHNQAQEPTNAVVDEALAAFGLFAEQPAAARDDPAFYLWPQHAAAFGLFADLRTQWRVGMGGATGLDYTAVIAHLRIVGVPRNELPLRYAEIRELETGALAGFAEQREEAER